MPRLEYVQVDKTNPRSHPDVVSPISAAIRKAREETGLTQEELAHLIGKVQSTVQKWEGGREPKLNTIAHLDETMGYRRGHILRLAGYVDDPVSVRDAIDTDPALTPGHKRIVLSAYDRALTEAADERSRSTSKPPTATRTRRS